MMVKITPKNVAELEAALKVYRREQNDSPRKQIIRAAGGTAKGYGPLLDTVAGALVELGLMDQVINHLAPVAAEETTEEAGE